MSSNLYQPGRDLLRTVLEAIAQNGSGQQRSTGPRVPDVWRDCEAINLPTWRPASRQPNAYPPWNDSLTNDEQAVRKIINPSRATWRAGIGFGTVNAQNFPITFEEVRLYAHTLYCAIVDFRTGFVERLPGEGNTQPNKLLKKAYTQSQLQARCFDVVRRLVKLHDQGCFLLKADDPTTKNDAAKEERSTSFEARFLELCVGAMHFKNIAVDLIIDHNVEAILAAPVGARQTKLDANWNNEYKRRYKIYQNSGGVKDKFDFKYVDTEDKTGARPGGFGAGKAARPSTTDPGLRANRHPTPPSRWGLPPQPRIAYAAPSISQGDINSAVATFFQALTAEVGTQAVLSAITAATTTMSLSAATNASTFTVASGNGTTSQNVTAAQLGHPAIATNQPINPASSQPMSSSAPVTADMFSYPGASAASTSTRGLSHGLQHGSSQNMMAGQPGIVDNQMAVSALAQTHGLSDVDADGEVDENDLDDDDWALWQPRRRVRGHTSTQSDNATGLLNQPTDVPVDPALEALGQAVQNDNLGFDHGYDEFVNSVLDFVSPPQGHGQPFQQPAMPQGNLAQNTAAVIEQFNDEDANDTTLIATSSPAAARVSAGHQPDDDDTSLPADVVQMVQDALANDQQLYGNPFSPVEQPGNYTSSTLTAAVSQGSPSRKRKTTEDVAGGAHYGQESGEHAQKRRTISRG